MNAFGIGGLNMHVVVDEYAAAHFAPLVQPPTKSATHRPADDDSAVAVVGMACILPGAPNLDAYWNLLASGRDPKTQATPDRWRTDLALKPGCRETFRTPTALGGYITDFQYDWRAHKLPPKQIAQADPLQFMLLEAADQALQDAGYRERPIDRQRVGVVVGTEFGGDFAFQLQMALRLPDMERMLVDLLTGHGMPPDRARQIFTQFADVLLSHWPALIDETGSFSTSSLASRITKTWDLMGGAAAIDSGSASSLAAVAVCVDMLLAGDCDMMVCAAGQRRMGLPTYEVLSLTGTLSTRDKPRSPFDAQADGYVPGEGVGVLLLKRLADARRDNDKIRAIIRGVGAGREASLADALRLAIDRSLDIAGVSPSHVPLVEADGFALPQSDTQQLQAMLAVYGRQPRREPLLLGSVVAQIGHTGGTSGMASLIKAALEIERGQVPATLGLETPLAIDSPSQSTLQAVIRATPVRQTTPDGRRLAGITSVAAQLAYHAILEHGQKVSSPSPPPTGEGQRVKAAASSPLSHSMGEGQGVRVATAKTSISPSVSPSHAWQIIRLGASTLDALRERLRSAAADPASLYAAAASVRFTPADQFRLAIVADSPAMLAQRLTLASNQAFDPAARVALEQKGIFYRQLRSHRPRIAMVFAGQGSQYTGMLRELVHEVPAAASAMAQIDASLTRHGYQTFAQMAWQENNLFGTDVWTTQAAMLSADAIVWAAVSDRGIRPDLVCGHSYGEYAALLAADAWTFDEALQVTRSRCDSIQSSETARGGMLATTAPPEIVEEIAAQLADRVYVANHNAPDQTVVAGHHEALRQFAALVEARAYTSRPLAVPSPFHCPLMQGAADLFAPHLARAAIQRPTIPLLSVATNEFAAEPDQIRANLVTHLVRPVRYLAMIRQIAMERETIFIEVGPQQALTRLNRRILTQGEPAVIATDNSSRPGSEQLFCVQAILECLDAFETAGRSADNGRPKAETSMKLTKTGEILNFDATARRRERMRRSSEGEQTNASLSRVSQSDTTKGQGQGASSSPLSHSMGERQGVRAAALQTPPAPPTPLPTNLRSVPAEEESSRDRLLKPAIAAAVAATPARTAPAGAELEAFLINFVVEQTGYPPEVVELDADLEADLGIDSIKKAQLFGELREYFDVTPSEDLTLDDFPTLRHVLKYLQGVPVKEEPTATPASLASPSSLSRSTEEESLNLPSRDQFSESVLTTAPAKTAPAGAELEAFLINFVVEQTGYPPEVVELDADLEADLGIDSIKKAQLFGELREYFDVTPSEDLTLDDFPTLRHVLEYLQGVPVKEEPTATPASLASPSSLSRSTEEGNFAPPRDRSVQPPPIVSSSPVAAEEEADAALFRSAGDVEASTPHIDRPESTAYETELERGRKLQGTIVAILHHYADLPDSTIADLQIASEEERPLTPEQLDQLQGIADAVGVPLGNIVALHRVMHCARPDRLPFARIDLLSLTTHLPLTTYHLPPTSPVPSSDDLQSDWYLIDGIGGRAEFTTRYVMRTVESPLPTDTPSMPQWQGAVLIVGNNPTAQALRQRIAASGVTVFHLAQAESPEAALATFDAWWQDQPIHHVFLLSARDPQPLDLETESTWRQRFDRHVLTPFFLCQRWVQRASEAKILDRSTLVAVTAMGGDLGFSGRVVAPEGGALAGLIKSLCIEVHVMRQHKNLRVKAIDAPDNDSPDVLADAILREVASHSIDYELAIVAGQRRLQTALAERAAMRPSAEVRPGGVWVVTGGARGISAACALELGRRFGVHLHLLGTSPQPQIDPSWSNLSSEEWKNLKAATMAQQHERGQNPLLAWERIEKAVEIDRTLAALAAAGVQATYHTCHVADRLAVARVLNEIRRTDGPIEGILHGAGIERACRFERKNRDDVLATFHAKVEGAWNLMTLTRDDPVKHFIGFGSITGRLGGNGQTDYAAASDMLCKLIAWYRTWRPDCHAVGFHWHPWDGVGMAARPETRAMFRMTGAPDLMPVDEGLRHLLRELYAGLPESEVMITNREYHQRYYGPEKEPAASDVTPATSPGRIAQRVLMRMVDAPLAPDAPTMPPLDGPALILGDNPHAQALARRLRAAGAQVEILSPTDDSAETLGELDRLWPSHPATLLVLMTGRDPDAPLFDTRATWLRRRERGAMLPFRVAQRWLQRLGKLSPRPAGNDRGRDELGGRLRICCRRRRARGRCPHRAAEVAVCRRHEPEPQPAAG